MIDLLHQKMTSMLLYGVKIASEISNQDNVSDKLYLHLMQTMTQCLSAEVRRSCIQNIKAPFT